MSTDGFTRSCHSLTSGNLVPRLRPASKRPRRCLSGFDPLAQTQLGPRKTHRITIKSQPGSVDAGQTQNVDFNGWQPKKTIGLEIPEAPTGELDYRYIRATSRRDISLVADALWTELELYTRVGCEVPQTPQDECYAVQYQIIQKRTSELWLLRSEPPHLHSLNSWTGGFDNWHGLKILDNGSDALVVEP